MRCRSGLVPPLWSRSASDISVPATIKSLNRISFELEGDIDVVSGTLPTSNVIRSRDGVISSAYRALAGGEPQVGDNSDKVRLEEPETGQNGVAGSETSIRRYLLDDVVRLVGETLGGGDGLSCARIILEARVDGGSSRCHESSKKRRKGTKTAYHQVSQSLEYLDVTAFETHVQGLAGWKAH